MNLAQRHPELLPQGTLKLAGALVAFAIGVTAVVRIAGIPPAASPEAVRAEAGTPAVASRSLRFTDRADGAVVIQDVGEGRVAAVIQPGEQTGFVRGVLRGLARDRKARGIGDRPPFTLTLWRDGQLSLTDTATGRSIELTAFGSSNRAAFAALLPAADRSTKP